MNSATWQQRGNITPYEVLAGTMYTLARDLNGKVATVNFCDIGINTKKKEVPGQQPLEPFHKTHALTIDGVRWLVGAIAPNYELRDTQAYLYGFVYNWEPLFERIRPGVKPRIMPWLNDDKKDILSLLFSKRNAYLHNVGGNVSRVSDAKGAYVFERHLEQIVQRHKVKIDGKTSYHPEITTRLAPLIYDALVITPRT